MNWTGTDGDNSRTGTAGYDYLDGRGGDDTLNGAGGGDLIYGGLGSDKLYGEAGDDTLIGGGSESPDLIEGGDGNDWMQGSATDSLIGGVGTDEFALDMSRVTAAQNVNLGRLLQGQTVTFTDGTLLSGLERGILDLGAGADFVRTGDGAFAVSGGGGDDTLLGGAADGWMEGGAGDDRLDGAAGIDWVAYSGVSKGVKVSLAITTAQNTKGAGTDTLSGFENLQGSVFNDQLIGDSGDNRIFGGGGGGFQVVTGDTLVGGGGDDQLSSNCANALMKGGSGDDVIGYDDFWFYSHTDYQTLIGGKGQDTLYLGWGDVSVFESLKDSSLAKSDRIRMGEGFNDNRIDLQLIDADATLAGDQAFTLVSAFSRHAGELMVTKRALEAGGFDTWVLMDVDGDGRADSKIILTGDRAGFDDFIL